MKSIKQPPDDDSRRKFLRQNLTTFHQNLNKLRNGVTRILPNPSFTAGTYAVLTSACHIDSNYALGVALLVGWLLKTPKS